MVKVMKEDGSWRKLSLIVPNMENTSFSLVTVGFLMSKLIVRQNESLRLNHVC